MGKERIHRTSLEKYTLNPNVIAKDTGVAFIDDTVAVVMNTYEEELARKNPNG